jgi:hypothetical protein
MAFPTSPINGQTCIVNNTSYTYNSTYGTWTVATNPSNTFVTSTSGYTRATFVATAGQTTFTTPYTVGGVEVFINGVLMANQLGLETISLTGFDGGEVGRLSNLNCRVNSNDIKIVEDLHSIFGHAVVESLLSR